MDLHNGLDIEVYDLRPTDLHTTIITILLLLLLLLVLLLHTNSNRNLVLFPKRRAFLHCSIAHIVGKRDLLGES